MQKCPQCGRDCDLADRFCPRCGAQLYVSLDQTKATPDSFLPLLNSLYNLLATRHGEQAHPARAKYLHEVSEKVMIRRCRIEHEETMKQWVPIIFRTAGAAERLMELYHLSLSNTLAGYTFRSVEEMICKKKTERISETKKSFLIDSMYKECGSEMAASEYKVLNRDDPVDNRLVFCLALRSDNRHLEYVLADDDLQALWWNTFFSGSIKLNEAHIEPLFRAILRGRGPGLGESEKETIRESVEQDLLHGYIVKLAESLDPL